MDRYLVYDRIYGRMEHSLGSYLWVLMLMGIYGRMGMDRYLVRYIIRGAVLVFREVYTGGETEKIYFGGERAVFFGGEIYIRNTPPYFLLSLLSSRGKILSLFPPLSPYIT